LLGLRHRQPVTCPPNVQAQRPPPETSGRLQQSLRHYPNRPTAQWGRRFAAAPWERPSRPVLGRWCGVSRLDRLGQATDQLTDVLGLTRSGFIEDLAPAALLPQISAALKKIEASSFG
jgi:hypothetical protein